MAERSENALAEPYASTDLFDDNRQDLDHKVFVITAVISTIIAVSLSSMFKSIPWISLLTGLISVLIAMALRSIFKRMSAEWTETPPRPIETEHVRRQLKSLEEALEETKNKLRAKTAEAAMHSRNVEGHKRDMEVQRTAMLAMSKKIKKQEEEMEALREELRLQRRPQEVEEEAKRRKRAEEDAENARNTARQAEAEAARKALEAEDLQRRLLETSMQAVEEAARKAVEMEALRKRLLEAENARRQVVDERAKLQQKVKEMERNIVMLQQEAERVEKLQAEEEAKLPMRLKETEQRVASLQHVAIDAATKVALLEEQKKREVENLAKQLAASLAEKKLEQEECERSTKRLSDQVASLQQQVRDSQRVTNNLQAEAQVVAKMRVALEEQVAEKIKQNAKLETQLVEASNRQQVLQHEVDRLIAFIKQLQSPT